VFCVSRAGSKGALEQLDHVVDLGEFVQQPHQLHQLQILRIVEPTLNRNRVFRLPFSMGEISQPTRPFSVLLT
jgi:hypothetical protein